MKKTSLLEMTKTALNFLYNIDPSITEHVIEMVCNQSALLRDEVAYVMRQQVELGRNRIFELVQPEAAYQSAA